MAPPVNAFITMQSWAFQRNKQGGHNQRQFNALCGDNPPTITDGYGKWAVIDRPLRQGVSIPQGFNPARVKVELRFGIWDGRFKKRDANGILRGSGWDTSDTAAAEVESNIDDLHWMAGGNALAGPSPVVYMDAYSINDNGLVRTDLTPRQYRGVPWVIDGATMTWGSSLRHQNGSRLFQDASFELLGYSPVQGGATAPVQQTRLAGGFFVTNDTVNTALGIAASNSSRAPDALWQSLATKLINDPRNNPCRGTRLRLERRSIYWVIPSGTAVWTPNHPI